jgi:hypothetical protein
VAGWLPLWDASSRLTRQFGLNGIELVERTVHSGEVPVRGSPRQIDSIPVRIEKLINSEMRVDIGNLSFIYDRVKNIVWWNIQIDWPKCVAYCKANLIPLSSSIQEQRQREGRPPKKFEAVKNAMRRAIELKEISREELATMEGKELAHTFNVGRTTATAARKAVLGWLESVANSISDK